MMPQSTWNVLSCRNLFQFISAGPALQICNLCLFRLKTVKFDSTRSKNNKLYHIWLKLKKNWLNESTTVFWKGFSNWLKYIFFSKYKIHNYDCQKNIIVNFIIQKLKSKHTSLKKYTNWDKLSCLSLYIFLREQEEIFFTYFGP